MKYDKDLYKKIANLKLNEIVKVSNRNGWITTIHIQNITALKWNQLQLLVPGAGNSFHKMHELYKFYTKDNTPTNSKPSFDTLTSNESKEVNDYISIFKSNNLTEHFQVNKYITENGLWNNFETIRSINNHGLNKEIPGIQPKYFNIICSLLNIQGGTGSTLVGYKKY